MAENMNIPRWDDAAAYPRRQDELSDDQWVWEFLRRTQDYRHDWLKYGDNDPYVGMKYELDRLIHPENPSKKLGKHIFQSLGGSLIDDKSHTPPSLLAREYELVVINPKKNLDKQWERAKKQLCQKRGIKDETNTAPRKRQRGTNNLILLLRVLDGHAQGASFEAMGKQLFQSTAKRAEKECEKAKELWLSWFDDLPF
jgi:hypothetical protein